MASPFRHGRSTRWALGGLILVPAVLFVVAGLLGDPGAADHARTHALIATVAAIVAAIIVTRRPTAGIATWAPVIGFAAFAVAQLLEGLGALGYDSLRDARGNLAVAHDIGVVASGLGLLAVVFGSTIGLAVGSWRHRRAARFLGAAISLALLVGGLFIVKTLIGF